MNLCSGRTLYGELAALAAWRGNEPWLSYEDARGEVRTWSAAAFLSVVHQTAHWLIGRGLGTGAVFALVSTNDPAHVQLALAASCLGATFVPLDPACTQSELDYFLSHCGSALVVLADDLVDGLTVEAKIKQADLSTFHRECATSPAHIPETPNHPLRGPGPEDTNAASAAGNPYPPPSPSRPRQANASPRPAVQLLYTSGTTAKPKAVMLTDTNFIHGAEVFRAASGLRPDDHHLITLPLFHAAAQCHALWPSLIARCRVTITSRFSASRFFLQAQRHDATMAALFGAPLRFLLAQPPGSADQAHRMRNITYAQNLTPAQYAEWHRRFRAPLQQLWGMTETCGLPLMSPLAGERRLETMGRPVLGYEVRIVDADGREVPGGEEGELISRGVPGESLMSGYLRDPAATAAALREHDGAIWLHSGDIARADGDGFIHFVRRGRDLIKCAGENISCLEVEAVLADLPGVLEICAVGIPDQDRDEALALAVVPAAGGDAPTAATLSGWCRERLGPRKVPRQIVFLERLARTSVGKLQRHLVRAEVLRRLEM